MTIFQRSNLHLNFPLKTPTYIIAVPRCHENLFQIIRDNHEWLSADGGQTFKKNNRELSFLKKINTEKEFNKLHKIIEALRTEKSELFIDPEYHPKPDHQRIDDYIAEFLKNKSISTYYTFKSYYRITVFPYSITDLSSLTSDDPALELRQEYLIIPLFIISKRGKTYEQMKTLSYNEDGTFTVHNVNPHHFWRVDPVESEQEEIDKKNKAMREKVIGSLP